MTTPTTESIPNPGSSEAVKRGCLCPVTDNNHGAGFDGGRERLYWIIVDCPLHGSSQGKLLTEPAAEV